MSAAFPALNAAALAHGRVARDLPPSFLEDVQPIDTFYDWTMLRYNAIRLVRRLLLLTPKFLNFETYFATVLQLDSQSIGQRKIVHRRTASEVRIDATNSLSHLWMPPAMQAVF